MRKNLQAEGDALAGEQVDLLARPPERLGAGDPEGGVTAVDAQHPAVEVRLRRAVAGVARRRQALVAEGHLPAQALEHLETSLRFMRVAEPVRVMERHEWEGTADEDFGLAPARYSVRLSGHGRSILAVRFGAANPQRVLQYARVDGRDELYLMPTFVGAEWERVWEHSTTAR